MHSGTGPRYDRVTATPGALRSSLLRQRGLAIPQSLVEPGRHYENPLPANPSALLRQRLRIQQFQRRWARIKEDLPPQLSRRHSTFDSGKREWS